MTTDTTTFLSRQKARLLGISRLFLLSVFIPTLISIIYFGFVASDVYISESRFFLRSPEHQSTNPLGMIFKGAGFARAQDETYAVADYLQSRDALTILDEKLHIRAAFSSARVDIFNRFAGLDWDDSFEALHRYYQQKIDAPFDSASGTVTLNVRAFTADDAHAINAMLLDLSEALVNQLNERARNDTIRFASEQLREAQIKAKQAAQALSLFRSQKSVVDPERQAGTQIIQLGKLQEELLATRSQLVQLNTFAKDNPQIPTLKKRIETLESEIKSETAKITGGQSSLTDKAVSYQRLELEREFADKQLAMTLALLEQARSEAQRKQLYLERIVQPSLPDIALEPRRLRGVCATFALGLIAWGILALFLAALREHQD